jgi:hypothetical protein
MVYTITRGFVHQLQDTTTRLACDVLWQVLWLETYDTSAFLSRPLPSFIYYGSCFPCRHSTPPPLDEPEPCTGCYLRMRSAHSVRSSFLHAVVCTTASSQFSTWATRSHPELIDKRNLCEFGWNHAQVHGNVLLFVTGFVEYCELTHQWLQVQCQVHLLTLLECDSLILPQELCAPLLGAHGQSPHE